MGKRDPVPIPPLSPSDRVRFWSNVPDRSPEGDACWEWRGSRTPEGYGRFSVGRRWFRAGRVMWSLQNGAFEGHVLHRCDNPPCVRPSHLFIGTHLENVADMVRKGRQSRSGGERGEAHPRAQLTEAQVLEIRARYTGAWGEQSALAREYDVSHFCIYSIVTEKTWKHLL